MLKMEFKTHNTNKECFITELNIDIILCSFIKHHSKKFYKQNKIDCYIKVVSYTLLYKYVILIIDSQKRMRWLKLARYILLKILPPVCYWNKYL